jgi:hypothetical protein
VSIATLWGVLVQAMPHCARRQPTDAPRLRLLLSSPFPTPSTLMQPKSWFRVTLERMIAAVQARLASWGVTKLKIIIAFLQSTSMSMAAGFRFAGQDECRSCCAVCGSPLPAPPVVTIVIQEYHIPYPRIMDSLTSAFSWANLSVFQLVQTGCKVRTAVPYDRSGDCQCPT